jgi:malonate transporter and related proteins
MLAVANALIPVFLVIAFGVVLRRTLLPSDELWVGMERITYFVLFPALLTVTTATADFSSLPASGIAVTMFLSVVALSTLLLVLRVPLIRTIDCSGAAYTSIFQGATRWSTITALAIAGALHGATGIAAIGVVIVAMVPLLNVINVWVLARYAAETRPDITTVVGHVLRNPFIWSSLAGLALNLSGIPLPKILISLGEILGRASLALGLLLIGAGLVLGDIVKPNARVCTSTVFKLIVMPAIAMGIGLAFGLTGTALSVVAIASSVPSAPGSYVLARQMGGDAPLLAHILTFETLVALATIPLAITAAEIIRP